MLAAQRTDILAVGLPADGGGSRQYEEDLRALLAGIGTDDELVLIADLYGGSPLTIALGLLDELGLLQRSRVFAGMSLPMVITAALANDALDLDALAAEILDGARQGALQVRPGTGPAVEDERI